MCDPILISSDNGAITWFHWNPEQGRKERTGCNYPYKGIKSDLTEGGTKVPTFVYSTKRKFAKKQFSQLVHFVDWFPTIIKLAGGQTSEEHVGKIDGKSAHWLFKNKKKPKSWQERKKFVYGVKHEFREVGNTGEWVILYSVRFNDWKYENFARTYRHFACPLYKPDRILKYKLEKLPSKYKKAFDKNTVDIPVKIHDLDFEKETLYNLKSDPFEVNNLMDTVRPAESHKKIIKKIRAWMEAKLGQNTPVPITGNDGDDAKTLVKELYNPMTFPQLLLESGRNVKGTVCTYVSNHCWQSTIQNYNYSSIAIKRDYEKLTELYKAGGSSSSLIKRLTRSIPYCEEWRKSVGLKTEFQIRIN